MEVMPSYKKIFTLIGTIIGFINPILNMNGSYDYGSIAFSSVIGCIVGGLSGLLLGALADSGKLNLRR